MPEVTKLLIYFSVDRPPDPQSLLSDLPRYCSETFHEHSPGNWAGEFVISCPVAPQLADGDFIDDFAPHFPALLKLKQFVRAEFELQIAVGSPQTDYFELPAHLVALVSALGASIKVVKNT